MINRTFSSYRQYYAYSQLVNYFLKHSSHHHHIRSPFNFSNIFILIPKIPQFKSNCIKAISQNFKNGKTGATGAVLLSSNWLLSFFMPKTKEELEEEVVLLIKKAMLAMKREQFDEAENHLNQAFKHCYAHGFEDALTQVVDFQANLAVVQGNLERAEQLFRYVAKRLVNLGRVEALDNSIIEISIKLADIFTKQNKIEQALQGLDFCINTQRQKIQNGVDDEDTLLLASWSLQNMSQLYMKIGTAVNPVNQSYIEAAIKLTTEALGYTIKAVGNEASQTLGLLCDLANTTAISGDYDKAVVLLQEVKKVSKEKAEELYPQVLVSMGNLYLMKDRFIEAESTCLEAHELATQLKDMESLGRAKECIMKSRNGLKKSNTDTTDQVDKKSKSQNVLTVES